MHITHFEISNYKSYRATAALNFLPGFNVITGQNSAGKTSLLEALTLSFNSVPHRSLETVPAPGSQPPDSSIALISLVIKREEMSVLLRGGGTFYLRIPSDTFQLPNGTAFGAPHSRRLFVDWFLSKPDFTVTVRRTIGNQETWFSLDPTLGHYNAAPPPTPQNPMFVTFRILPDGTITDIGQAQPNEQNDISLRLAQVMRSRIYRFFAERFNIGRCPFGANSLLAANAQNLPEVLNTLQGNPQRFLQLNHLLHEILPQVQCVSILPLGSELEIRVWPHDPNSQREDLALPLNLCGSGIAQVVAILYVVLTASHSQVILIDEPQSLLHPGAVRKLIEVLKRFPRHQYILATHSPTVITASNPSTVTVAKLEGVETRFQRIDTRQTQDLQLYLADIGARLSDVFGADNILWVEGQTEELAFPFILSTIPNRSLMGTAIIGIKQTGDLEGRDAKRVFELYHRLSGATAILPPALAFILDRECRSQSLRDDLQRESGGRAHFLSRRMFENYLLNAAGIVVLANDTEGFRAAPITQEEVTRLIDAKRADLRYFCPGARALPGDWLAEIDGARVLKEIFEELSETRVAYDKVRHSVALTRWLIDHEPAQLQEISDLLAAVLPFAA
jgi:predicted ATPase